MPASPPDDWAALLPVVVVYGSSFLYIAVGALIRRLREGRSVVPAGQPKVYRDLAAEAQARQLDKERLARAVNTALDDALEAVGAYYDTTAFTGPPADPWGQVLLEDAARTHSLHHR